MLKCWPIVDISASHNFFAKKMAKSLCLDMTKSFNQNKVANSTARDMIRITANILVTIGNWVEYVNFLIVPLDDFELILEMIPFWGLKLLFLIQLVCSF